MLRVASVAIGRMHAMQPSNKNNITITMIIMLSLWQSHYESSSGSFGECRVSARWPPTLKPTDLGCATIHIAIAIYYYYSARKLMLMLLIAPYG